MNRRNFLCFLGLGAVALTTTATLARRQSRSRPPRIVTTKTNAYLIGKIEPVLTGKIEEVAPAPTGRYAIITQDLRPEPTDDVKEPFGEQKLWVYDALRRTTKLFHRVQDDSVKGIQHRMGGAIWFPDSKKVILQQVSGPTLLEEKSLLSYALGLMDVDRSAVRWLTPPTNKMLSIQGLPGIPVLLCQEIGAEFEPTKRYCFLSSDGVFGPMFTIGGESPLFPSGLSVDRKSLLFMNTTFRRVVGQEKPQREDHWYAVRLSDTQVTALKEKPQDRIPFSKADTKPKLPLTIAADTAKLTGGAGRIANTNALWLEAIEPGPEKKFNRALVAAEADSQSVQLLNDLSAVLYTHDDALYAAPIASLDRVAFEKMMKQLAISNAKQTGLALMMYAQDYDENFPHDPGNVKEAIFPYIKDNDTLAEFVYTYKGPLDLGKVEKPSETAMGYIPSPGGRAVVYADGHVKWEPTPEK
ncbi:hypothetical protein [Armatimonas sp.]|uniref:hypothetical protein n=1 Tax=Armatimonas sp. TaxID=1872638 RepID=UPI00286B8E3C|nr:hypothetical protein [Armatimonas sp.]